MKNYQENDYALNKYSKGIVYRFDDMTVTVMLEDYLAENPDKTEDDFLALKRESDRMYRREDRADHKQTYRNMSLKTIEGAASYCTPSPEDIYIAKLDTLEEAEQQQERLNAAYILLDKLTPARRRRFLLHAVEGMTTRQIAEMEGTNQKNVHKSIQAAKRELQGKA